MSTSICRSPCHAWDPFGEALHVKKQCCFYYPNIWNMAEAISHALKLRRHYGIRNHQTNHKKLMGSRDRQGYKVMAKEG